MDFKNMSDKQIIEAISQNMEKKRLSKKITAEDMATKGGHSSQVYSNFINKNTNIKLETLIQMFRGIGELDKLQKAFEFKEQFSLYNHPSSKQAKRIRPKQKKITVSLKEIKDEIASRPKWGEDEE